MFVGMVVEVGDFGGWFCLSSIFWFFGKIYYWCLVWRNEYWECDYWFIGWLMYVVGRGG